MSIESSPAVGGKRNGTVSVNVEFEGSLVARLSTRQARVSTPAGSSLKDLIEAWADEEGVYVKYALLDGDRLRGDTKATRISDGRQEPMSARTRVANGDTVHFEFQE